MKKPLIISFSLLLILLFDISFVLAQAEQITLKFSRDFGYSSGTGKIQGLFSMKVTSTVQLSEVVFYIDGDIIGKDFSEPFSLQFNTEDFSPEIHKLYAIGLTLDGKELKTREEVSEFITAQESNKATLTLIVPILGLALIAVVFSAVIPAIFSKKKGVITPGTARNYGAAGGTICPRCNRPFSRHVFTPNMLFGKLERCPSCGKWGIFRAYPIDVLRNAEEAELNLSKSTLKSDPIKDENDKLQNELNNTKYQGL